MCTLLYVKRKENKYIFYSKSKKEMNEFCCAIALTVFFPQFTWFIVINDKIPKLLFVSSSLSSTSTFYNEC